MTNKGKINNPPIKLNLKDKDIRIINIPKYIGLREKLKLFAVTKVEAFSILIGLIVVLYTLKEETADTRIEIPTNSNSRLVTFRNTLLNSGKKDLVKKIHRPKNKVTKGGGILLFTAF